ncbi:hypothetical protein CHUAL_010561 [Chamberlinius hualienensis]
MSDDEERSSEEESEEEEVKPAPPKKAESDAERRKREAEEEERRKKEEKERKKAEVRKRLEEASKAKKGKKGFMTPERKKKLRLLLRKKAADELKKEQERKAQERRRIINERCGHAKNIEGVNEAALVRIVKEYYDRYLKLEDALYDLQYDVRDGEFKINELNIQVNDLRGKFVKPSLRKVSKYDQSKFAKLQKATKAQDFDFRSKLKPTENSKFKLGEEDKELSKKEDKPAWAQK